MLSVVGFDDVGSFSDALHNHHDIDQSALLYSLNLTSEEEHVLLENLCNFAGYGRSAILEST